MALFIYRNVALGTRIHPYKKAGILPHSGGPERRFAPQPALIIQADGKYGNKGANAESFSCFLY
jgi:hypothetical protein